MQNEFNVWALRTNWLKILFSEDLGWIQVFLKIFLSHTHAFYSYNNVLRGISAPKCYVFQKNDFSRFSINRTCCSTDRKCDKNFGYSLPGSIGARSIEIDFWSIKSNFWPIKNQSESFLKKSFLTCSSHCSHFFKKLSLFSSSTDSLQVNFCRFFPNFSQGFCLQVPVRPFSCILGEIFEPIDFWSFWFLSWFLSKLITGFLFLGVENMFPMH